MIVDRRKKARKELAALDKGVRRKPLERKVSREAIATLVFCLVIAVLVLLFALFWTWPGLVQY
jgi:type VI protein secretion system component VasF